MKSIITDINSKEADRVLYTDFADKIQTLNDIIGKPNSQMPEYLRNLYYSVLQARLIYLGTVSAWLDTLPKEVAEEHFKEVRELAKSEVQSGYLLFERDATIMFATGYHNGMTIIGNEANLDVSGVTPEQIDQNVVLHIQTQEPTVVDNMFEVLGAYEELTKRQEMGKEIRLVHMPIGNSFNHHLG